METLAIVVVIISLTIAVVTSLMTINQTLREILVILQRKVKE